MICQELPPISPNPVSFNGRVAGLQRAAPCTCIPSPCECPCELEDDVEVLTLLSWSPGVRPSVWLLSFTSNCPLALKGGASTEGRSDVDGFLSRPRSEID
jgi:hypothetical protein